MRKDKKLSYSCVAGYTTETGTQEGRITCTAKGWSPVPQCYTISLHLEKCKKPLLENGFFYGRETSFKIHEKLQYKCNLGYHTPNGGTEDTVQCQADGWSSQPSCTKNFESCQVPDLHHGYYFTTQQELQVNETLQYECDEGYHTAGGNTTEEARCLAHGWSLTPNCTRSLLASINCFSLLCVFFLEITCYPLSRIEHGGFYPVKKIYEEGDVVHFFCEANYSFREFDLIQCYYFGWYPDPPVCEDVRNKCPPPPLPPHAHVTTVRRTYRNGDKVRIQCQSKFEIRGYEEIQCEKGKWTSPPICIGSINKQESEPTSLELDAAIRTSKTYHSEEITTNKDDLSTEKQPIHIDCNQQESSVDIEMQQSCTSPPVIRNGVLLSPLLLSYKNGSSVEYGCQVYHFLDGPSTVYCKEGNWTEQPTCLAPREKCDSPPPIANGALKLPPLAQYESGSSVQYSCYDYHFLQGSERIYCSAGQWTSPPVCIEPCTLSKNEMEKNNVLLEGFYGNQVYFYHGDYVGFYCKQNHFGEESGTTLFQVYSELHMGITFQATNKDDLSTEKQPICIDCNQQESSVDIKRPCGSIPAVANAAYEGRSKEKYEPGETVRYQCHEGFQVTGPPEIFCRRGNWSTPPNCEDVRCGAPPEILNAHIISTQHQRYLPGAKVHYECESNSQIMGVNYVICSDGHWTKVPSCRDVTCEPPPEIAGGKVQGVKKPRYLPGETAHYQCWQGFQMMGASTVTCQNGTWTEQPQCKAFCTTSKEDMNRNNIELKWVVQRHLSITSRNFIEFDCKIGYVQDPASSPFRVQCMDGTLEYPRCKPGRNCRLSETAMERNNIKLRWSRKRSNIYRSKETILFECNSPYRKVSNPEDFEAQCHDGVINYPRCAWIFA
ncbi:Coagulation factor XIII B chain [Aix galericulata]|nr:Coagulation factor XIII B chain [Aix galericulata]